ncbi:MAG TPA: hypothetical protein VGE29_08080 [Prosthecobacter sp.]
MKHLFSPLLLLSAACLSAAEPAEPRDIGSRWELFLDSWLVASQNGVERVLHEPVRREVVLKTDQPWEGPACGYFSAIQDGKKVRLYYRGSTGGPDNSQSQVTCVVESTDGIRFTRPKLGLIEVNGSKDNNVVWRGVESHNMAVFLDRNPAAKPEEKYKALGGVKEPGKNWLQGETPGGLYAFGSADGLHWHKIRTETVLSKGTFDSQNVAFWDAPRNRYASYSRIFTNKIRDIQSSHSANFLDWGEATGNLYEDGVPREHFYTSATVPCPTAPHVLVAFPKRYVPGRKKVPSHPERGVSDTVIMSSRDGVHWDRSFLEAWLRPGPDQGNWTERSNMVTSGIVETSPTEWSLYASEHYRTPSHRLRRLSIRKQGFASMHARAGKGEFVTHPFRFEGKRLLLNSSTSATGSIQVEIQDTTGKPIPGFALADMPEMYGDEMEAEARWKKNPDLAQLSGKEIRLRIAMRDADLYALRFAP